MSTQFSAAAPVHGRIDRDGRLIEADRRLAELHARAGGTPGGIVAVPQLAALVRLVRRLGIVVSRGVVAADGDQDLDLWVRARPDGEGVQLAIVGWTGRPAAQPFPAHPIEREQDFLRASADWVWETDDALRLTGLSSAAMNAVAESGEGLLGQPLTRLFALVEAEDGSLPILEALATQRRFDNQLADVRGEEGMRMRLSAVPLLDGAGRFAGFRGAAAEATEAPHVAETDTAGAFGQRLDAALRTPLSLIIAGADNIRAQAEGPLRADYADYAGDIASAGRHLLALIDDLVDLQAIERPGFRLARDPIDLADVARRAAGLLAVRAADRGVRIDRPGADEALPAMGDFRRALQVLVNLIGNAVRYSPEGGAVWIRCEREGDIAAVIVADQGLGIAAADQGRIFGKFERVDPAEPGGSGLGLYISRRLARAMGGDIAVDSAPGQGARFILTLKAG